MVVVRCRMAITDLPPNTCTEDDAGASDDLRGPHARRQVEASISVRLAPPILQNDQASDLAPLAGMLGTRCSTSLGRCCCSSRREGERCFSSHSVKGAAHVKPQVACGGVTGIECPRPLRGVTGKYALRADRLLFCGKLPPNTTTEDLADVLASSLEEACGGDEQLWERLKPNRGTPFVFARARIFPALRGQWAS